MLTTTNNDGHVTVTHITAHTNHQPGHHDDIHIPLPKSTKEERGSSREGKRFMVLIQEASMLMPASIMCVFTLEMQQLIY